MKKILTLWLLAVSCCAYAQFDENYKIETEEDNYAKTNLGLGVGLDYGGFGAKLSVLPDKHMALFGGLGYNIHKFGFNVGAAYRILPDSPFVPHVSFMYGYNGVIVVQGAPKYNKTYYGPSLGVGGEIHMNDGSNFFNLGLNIPFRNQAFHDDWEKVKNDPSITITSDPLPVAISIGYHFVFE